MFYLAPINGNSFFPGREKYFPKQGKSFLCPGKRIS
jgi:hypothetical protein